jgi:hypothetical protein
MIIHVDSKAWHIVEEQWPWFKEEPRHLKLGLVADRANPYFL